MLTQKQIPLCSPDSKIVDTLVELSNKQCGAVLVVDEMKKLLGIFTDGDLRRTLQKKGTNALETSISSIMTKTPCMVGPDKPVWEAMKIMEGDQKHPVMVLPVVEKCGTVVGIIKMHDIVQSGVGL
jgi:arabinose-5-phosphate isomerase